MKVAVVGLGRIGLPTAVLCGRRGHDVVGVDCDPNVLAAIAARAMPYEEPGLELDGFAVVPAIEDIEAEVWVVAVGTASAVGFDIRAVEDVVARIARRGAQLVVVESTVPPGTCGELAERHALRIAHCPERARPGQVFDDIATMPRLVGGVDAASTRAAIDFYTTLTDAPLLACTATESELAKLAENAEREVRIAFANELADAALAAGVDAARVIELANSHPRTSILRPGVGVGGQCLPLATGWFARRADGVTAAARALHTRRPAELARRLTSGLKPGARICVLGRTYRPDTRYQQPSAGTDRYRSPAIELIAELRKLGFEVCSWDPSDGTSRARAEEGADLVIVATPHAELKSP